MDIQNQLALIDKEELVVKKRKKPEVTLDDKIIKWQNSFTHASKKEILDILVKNGFSIKAIDEGKALLGNLKTKRKLQLEAIRRKLTAGIVVNQLKDEADQVFAQHIESAKVIFDGSLDILNNLGIKGRRETNLNEWVQQTKNFYKEALANKDILGIFKQHALDEKTLKDAEKAIKKVVEKRSEQLLLIGESKAATKAKDITKEAFETWVKIYNKRLKLALKQEPEMLVLVKF